MKVVEATRMVNASPADVWALVTDLEGSEQIISGITRIERLDAGPGFGIGTRWRETRVLFGREAVEEMEVTAIEPERSYTVEADGRGAHYRSVLTVEPSGEGTVLSMTFGGEPIGLAARIMAATAGRLFEGATRKAFERDLADIAAAAESKG